MSVDQDKSLPLSPIELGGFELERPLGQGGMAQVFLATHRLSQEQVALKLLLPQRAQDLRWRQSLRHEALAMARMRHVHIASLIDFGSVDEASAQASHGRLIEGAFWYAMELVGGQTLRRHTWLSCWEQLTEVVLALLDALAHAHARGVIHRDLKPDNILVRLHGPKLNALKLLDFGIALSGQQEHSSPQDKLKAVLGTPTYMAPEQIQGERVAQGPWTDLYALGCLVWRLVCGQPPFRHESMLETLKAHMSSPLPPLEPRFAVPDELELWLGRCLAKAPSDRFSSAFLAAAHWLKMESWLPKAQLFEPYEPPREHDAVGQTRMPLELPTLVIPQDGLRATTASDTPSQGVRVRVSRQEQLVTVHTQSIRMVVPRRWGRPGESIYRPPGWRISARLIRVRPPPLIGRAPEREQLWEALVRVAQINVCELVTIEGPVGVGKSALMRWMTERASELGAAEIVMVTHHDPPSPGDGLWGALARFYGLNLMPSDRAAQQAELEVALTAHLGLYPEQAAALAFELCGLVLPGADASWQRDLNAMMAWFELICARGPLILAIDDLHRGYEAAEVARALLERTDGMPLLILATCAEAQLAKVEPWRVALWAHPRQAQVLLEPLGRDQCAALCDELYQLPTSDRLMICERAHGLPSRVIDAVDELVTCGELGAGDELDEVALDDSLLLGEPTQEQQAQELLAILGQRASIELLVKVVTASGLVWQPQWLERWVEQGLICVAHEVIELQRASFAQSLRLRARQSGRWAGHHACALETILSQSLDATGLERAAHHAVESGDEPRALSLLHRAASQHFVMNRVARTLSLLHRRAALIDQRDGDAITEDKVLNATLLLHVMMDSEEPDIIKAQVSQLQLWFDQLPDPSPQLKLRWLYSRMRLHLNNAELHDAVALFEQADKRGEVDETQSHGAHCVRNWALVLEDLGLLKRAWLAQLRALRCYLEHEDLQGVGFVCYRLGYVALALGLIERSESLAHLTLAHFERIKILSGVTNCRFLLMDIALAKDQPQQASHHIKSVELRAAESSAQEQWLMSLNLAHVELFAHQYDRARETLTRCLRLRHQLSRMSRLMVQLLQLILVAHDQDWASLEPLYQRWIEQMTSTGCFFKDVPWALRRVAASCVAGGRPELASRFERDAAAAAHRHAQQRAFALESLTQEQLERPFEALNMLSQR